MKNNQKRVSIFYRSDNTKVIPWENKIRAWIKSKHPEIRFDDKKPNIVITLGGDGTILEAARVYKHCNPLFIGLNLGHVGFLASIRTPKEFLSGLDLLFHNKYHITKRMMLAAKVIRKGKTVMETTALNDIVAQNLLNVSEIEVWIDNHMVQEIRGTGVLVATGSGSTAYNLSLHGPIVTPDIKCFIITELLDHNTPTPSMVVKKNKTIKIKIKDFRQIGSLTMTKTGEPVDMLLATDGTVSEPLLPGDEIIITKAKKMIKTAEIEEDYFFKSVKSKFSFH